MCTLTGAIHALTQASIQFALLHFLELWVGRTDHLMCVCDAYLKKKSVINERESVWLGA